MSEVAALLDSLSKFVWPALVAVLLAKLFPLVRKILEERSFSVELGGTKVSVQQATEGLVKQITDLQNQVELLQRGSRSKPASEEAKVLPASPPAALAPARTLSAFPAPPMASAAPAPPSYGSSDSVTSTLVVQTSPYEAVQAGSHRILWVDDHPENNVYEIAKLQKDGFHVLQARSTDEALAIVSGASSVDAVITDMRRKEKDGTFADAGIRFVRAARTLGFGGKVFVYTRKHFRDQFGEMALAAGADAITSSPVELYALIRTLGNGEASRVTAITHVMSSSDGARTPPPASQPS